MIRSVGVFNTAISLSLTHCDDGAVLPWSMKMFNHSRDMKAIDGPFSCDEARFEGKTTVRRVVNSHRFAADGGAASTRSRVWSQ